MIKEFDWMKHIQDIRIIYGCKDQNDDTSPIMLINNSPMIHQDCLYLLQANQLISKEELYRRTKQAKESKILHCHQKKVSYKTGAELL